MPFIKSIVQRDFQAGFWKMDEPVDELYNRISLSDTDLRMYNGFTSQRRQKEFLTVRALMQILSGEKQQIGYDILGRPFLLDSVQFISVSHSLTLAAVLFSGAACGLDVEDRYRRVDRVAARFLSEAEFNWTASSDDPGFVRIICWSAKEAIFKMAGETGVDFARQIAIPAFEPVSGSHFRAEFYGKEGSRCINLRFELVENNVAVWCVEGMDI